MPRRASSSRSRTLAASSGEMGIRAPDQWGTTDVGRDDLRTYATMPRTRTNSSVRPATRDGVILHRAQGPAADELHLHGALAHDGADGEAVAHRHHAAGDHVTT